MSENHSKIPNILYGTAWKEDSTEQLVILALKSGFRAIDTANQRKHYFEEAVGNGLQIAYQQLGIKREDVFLQTKFTYINGQDKRLPYDPEADIKSQVLQSFASSQEHLKTEYIDSYVLHGPALPRGLCETDLMVWQTMEQLHQQKKIGYLGISNVSLQELQTLYKHAVIKPSFVQNRCFADTGWDKKVRDFCREHNIVYQGFSLLTANSRFLDNQKLYTIADKYQKTLPQIIFNFARHIGMLPLTGTTNDQHMQDDLGAFDFVLDESEIQIIETVAFRE
mgnify:CR=1 FL=1